ncbi:metabotropic glutamate receptor 6 isoform X2 [Megalopta genalis]|uniref:metabotropic glutamate receptor 6 isoform X2 n=1 Tax=Megalopta genalis TaxID=115081 RepID=UPI003FCF6ECA
MLRVGRIERFRQPEARTEFAEIRGDRGRSATSGSHAVHRRTHQRGPRDTAGHTTRCSGLRYVRQPELRAGTGLLFRERFDGARQSARGRRVPMRGSKRAEVHERRIRRRDRGARGAVEFGHHTGRVGADALLDPANLLHGHVAVLEQQGKVPAVFPNGTERREPSARHARDTSVSTPSPPRISYFVFSVSCFVFRIPGRRFEWTYASIVYSDSEYGDHGYETLISLASEYSICFTAPHRIKEDRFADRDYDDVVHSIVEKTDVRVVVLFAEKSATLRVLEAASRMGLHSKFVWLGSDSWPDRIDEERRSSVLEMEGALAVQPLYAPLSGFDEYFTGLTLVHEKQNPWFREFWYKYHGCGYSSEERAEDGCADPNLRIDRSNGYKQRRFLHFVRDAVYAVAYALRDAQTDSCGPGYRGICERMRSMDGETFSRYLSNVSFADESGYGFEFVNQVDGPPRYSILNFRRTSNGSYRWAIVGNYTPNEQGRAELRLDREKMRFRGEVDFPASSCSRPCGSDRIMVRAKEDPCCWRCQSCGLYRYRVDEHRCEECARGTRPTANGTGCEPIPEQFVDHSNPWAIAAMAVAVLGKPRTLSPRGEASTRVPLLVSAGISLTGFVFSVFWWYRETPMIKASGRELSFLLLVGALASFSITFAIVAKPSTGSCAVVRFGIGFCYTVCYAALATKINRIHRIFNDPGPSPRKRRYTSPRSQLTIAGILTLAEVALDAAWLLREPPSVINSYPSREANVRICRGSEDGSYVIGLAYPFVLTVASTFYAIKTRKCPEGFNETRLIGFANYATIVLWLAFVPLYLASVSNLVRAITLALSLSLNGLVQLLCLFLPKVYVVLIKPEKNTRELVMSRSPHAAGSSNPTVTIPLEVPSRSPSIANRSARSDLQP